MTAERSRYASGFEKVAGMVPETVALLRAWTPGMSAETLADAAVAWNLLGKATTNRVRDMVTRGFAQRYLQPDDSPARVLKTLSEAGMDLSQLRTLLFIYTSRSSSLLADFMVEVYWRNARAGRATLGNPEVQRFIIDSFGTTKLPAGWADSLVTRVARGLTRALADFGFLRSRRAAVHDIIPWRMNDYTARFLCHEAHVRGVSDLGILELPEWAWLGMETAEVPGFLSRLSASSGDFLFQYSGEMARFSWSYAGMEGFLNAKR